MKKGLVLKTIAAVALIFTGFPLLITCDANTHGNTEFLRLLAYHGVIAAVAFIGYAMSAAIPDKKVPNALLRIFGFLTFFAGMFSLLFGGDFVSVFALGCNCVLSFFVGQRFQRKNFAELFPLFALGIFIALSIGCYIFAYAALEGEHYELVRNSLVICFTAEFAIAALLMNQSGIFDRSNRRKETKTTLPEGLSAYNAALVLGITVTGLLLCIFREYIAKFITLVVVGIIRLIVAIMNLFPDVPIESQAGEEADISSFFLERPGENYVLQAILTVITVTVIFLFRKQLFSMIKSFFAMLGSFLGSRTDESDKVDFTDVFEDLHKEKKRREKAIGYNEVMSMYRSEKDLTKKFRLGYRLLLFRIKSFNRKLSPADTPSEQAERGEGFFDSGELKAAASYYDGIRYNDRPATADQLEALDRLITGNDEKERRV